jgi:hypothetical protein
MFIYINHTGKSTMLANGGHYILSKRDYRTKASAIMCAPILFIVYSMEFVVYIESL